MSMENVVETLRHIRACRVAYRESITLPKRKRSWALDALAVAASVANRGSVPDRGMGVAQMSVCKDYTKAAEHLGSPSLSNNAICQFAEAQRLGEVLAVSHR
jgi:hypothetical protein